MHLYSQSGGKLRFDEALACFVPGVTDAGRALGRRAATAPSRLADCLAEGVRPAPPPRAAAGSRRRRRIPPIRRESRTEARSRSARSGSSRPRPVGHGKAKHFVDFQNDVTAADVLLAPREGYRSVEHLKRYTTIGMATDQGKTGNVNALAILARRCAMSTSPQVGTTTFRPPYTPVTFGAFAGRDIGRAARSRPQHADAPPGTRRTARVFEPVGQWHRAWYYPKPGENMHAAVKRECKAARDPRRHRRRLDARQDRHPGSRRRAVPRTGSTPTPGPSSAVGKCRYGLMLRRGRHGDRRRRHQRASAPDHFHMTTTTGGAAARAWPGWRTGMQTEWPDLKVYLTSRHRALGGHGDRRPEGARACWPTSAPTSTCSPTPSRIMSFREGTVAGVPARVFRISFTGELSYEINVPPRLRPRTSGSACMAGRRAIRHHALRHRRPCTCCAPRRASSSSARTPTAR